MADRRPMIAGNWKMNLDLVGAADLISRITQGIAGLEGVDVLVAPPFPLLPAVNLAIGDAGIFLAAQNMHWEPEGAYTGEVCAGMLLDVGCTHVILGHSERRILFRESSEEINRKAMAATRAGLIPIVCFGETLEEREERRTFDVVRDQLDVSLKGFRDEGRLSSSTILAYEPVWAIGTGKTATPQQAQEVQDFVRGWLRENFKDSADVVRILYGGSVKADNIRDLMSMPDIDGALVGGASLKADAFLPIVRHGAAQAPS